MNNQIFSRIPNIHILYDFLELIYIQKTSQYYYITPYSFHKSTLNDNLTNFIETIKPYYKKSKLNFIQRNHTYKSLLTLIRQLCNTHHVYFAYSIKYSNSIYEIHYKIYFKQSN